MGLLTKCLSVVIILGVFVFAVMFAYANLTPLTPGEKIYLKQSTALSVIQLPRNCDTQMGKDIIEILSRQPGIISYTMAVPDKIMAVTYNTAITEEGNIVELLRATGIEVRGKHAIGNSLNNPLVGLFYKTKYALCLNK